jgi:glycosyltransferase involved in cell wall biosynthesis
MDEEDRIEPCLQSLQGWADEIIVVDSGSRDRTPEICRRFTPNLIETYWRGYGRQKQFALEAASTEWVLSLDADEVVTPELRDEIDRVLSETPSEAAFRIPRQHEVFGKTLRHGDCGGAPIRLFRREGARFSEDLVHEHVVPAGGIGRLKSRLTHFSLRDIDHALEKDREYAGLWATQQRARGRRVNLLECFVHAAWCFVALTVFRGGWLDGRRGIVLAVLQSQYTFNKYVTLWTLQLTDAPVSAESDAYSKARLERHEHAIHIARSTVQSS